MARAWVKQRSGWARLMLAGVLLAWCAAWAQAQVATPAYAPPLALTNESAGRINLAPYFTVREDIRGEWDAATAFSQHARGDFTLNQPPRTALGFREGAIWYHAVLYNRSHPASLWLLSNEYGLLDRMDTYSRYADGRIEHRESGDALVFHARGAPYRNPNAWLDLPRGQPVELMVRVQSGGSMQVPLTLWSPAGFAAHTAREQSITGMYVGVLLAMLFYNLVMWASLRDASHAWYAAHIATFAAALLVLQGTAYQYAWPGSTRIAALSVPWAACAAGAAMLMFVRAFLDLRARWRIGNLACLVLVGLLLATALAAWWLPEPLALKLALALASAAVGQATIAILVVLIRGFTPAVPFLVAWLPVLIGCLLFGAVAVGWSDRTVAFERALQLGSTLEMLLMSVVLGYRYAALRDENTRVVRDARQQLEDKVDHRTAELKAALAQLEHVHARTRDSSQRDPLTGLYNRRYFRETFERLLKDARETRTPVSVFMIDLDHFKVINDRYGHVVGDDCLRFTSRTIGPVLRPTGALLARFGGEEFVVVLNGYDLSAAHAVAEDVRRAMCEHPCRSGGHAVQMSCSIGLHVINPLLEDNIDQAIEKADKALYRAKADGRNCVRASIRLPDEHDVGVLDPVSVMPDDVSTVRERRAQS